MNNLFNLQTQTTRNDSSSTGRIIAVPAGNVSPASVLRNIETRPLQGLPRNINRAVRQVNVKNALPRITTTQGLIDVVNNFDWTNTPSRAASAQDFKIPSVRVEEFEMSRDSVLNAIRYQLDAFLASADDNVDALQRLVDAAKTALPKQPSASTDNVAQNVGTGITNIIQSIAGGTVNLFGDAVTGFFGGARDFAQGIVNALPRANQPISNSSWLRALDGLYTFNSTNFQYIFPFFENEAMRSNVSFGNIESVLNSKLSRNIYGTFQEFSKDLLAGSELSQPGVYVEQPQIMNIANTTGSSFRFSFPLLNTLSFESAVKNYQLLWLLAFQNKPYRQSKTVASPAKIYRVHVPGIKYMHFAYMSEVSVDFVGVRRTVRIPMPSISGTPNLVNVVMPDVYNVNISFTSLTTDLGNFMIEQLKRGNNF